MTTVRCSATDGEGDAARASFKVSVRSARRQLRDLIARLDASGLPTGRRRRLRAALRQAEAEVARGARRDARTLLTNFAAGVRHEAGAGLAVDVARDLVTRARRIRAVLR